MDKFKLIIIGTLPALWLIYLLFELITGRISSSATLIANILLLFLFGLAGYIIHLISTKHPKNYKIKNIIIFLFILLVLDQGVKLIIHLFFFNKSFDIISGFLSFQPIINSDGSWLNARFGTDISFTLLICINIIALFLFLELYRYIRKNNKCDFWGDICFCFIFIGALCSLIDKVFYGGSLDFIGISNLFIADIKDIYINLGILFLLAYVYKSDYLSSDEDSSIKDDIKLFKTFFVFIKNDISSFFKKDK